MKNAIANSEYEYLLEEAKQNGEEVERQEDSIITFLLPKKVGNGGQRDFQLRHECEISIKDGQLWHTMCLDSYIPESQQKLLLGFHLSNNTRILSTGQKFNRVKKGFSIEM